MIIHLFEELGQTKPTRTFEAKGIRLSDGDHEYDIMIDRLESGLCITIDGEILVIPKSSNRIHIKQREDYD